MKLNRYKKIFVTAIMLIFVISIFLLCHIISINSVGSINKINSLILSGTAKLNYDFDNNFVFQQGNNISKDFSNFEKISTNVLLPIVKKDSDNFSFKNDYGMNLPFSLEKKIDENLSLKAIYDAKNKQLNFITPSYQYILGDQQVATNKEAVFSSNHIMPDDNIVIGGGKMINLTDYNNDSFTDLQSLQTNGLIVYKNSAQNILGDQDSSFQKLWQANVGDCTVGMPGKPNISMALSNDSTSGRNSLRLTSNNHWACSGKVFPVYFDANKLYKLTFDYKNISGGKVRYYYNLINSKGESREYSETIVVKDNVWHTFMKSIDPNQDITQISIYFYAPSNGNGEAIDNLYDNLKMEVFFPEPKKIQGLFGENKYLVMASNILLKPGENELQKVVNKNNLLDNNESSFKNLWQEKVGDCTVAMPGDPKISMEKSNDSPNGEPSLKLSSGNHWSCSGKIFPVKLSSDKLYKLTFNYKNISGGKIRYYYNLINSKGAGKEFSETVAVSDNEWHSYESIIKPDDDINKIFVYFYAPSNGNENVSNIYNKVELHETSPRDMDSYYLYAHQSVDESPRLKDIEFIQVNNFMMVARLHNVNQSFLLSLPDEKYSSWWRSYAVIISTSSNNMVVPANYNVTLVESNRQASWDEVSGFIASGTISAVGNKFISKNFGGSIRNDNMMRPMPWVTWFSKPIDDSLHYQINNYGNAWWINIDELCGTNTPPAPLRKGGADSLCRHNADGTYDIALIIENKWNKILEIVLVFSGTILVGCLINLVYKKAK